MPQTPRRQKTATIAWVIWFLTALFYFYEYILRSAPSVMLPQLERHFHISSADLGVLLGAYYYSYAPLQLVAGALVDRFGAKRVVPFAAILCGVGALLFIVGNFYLAGLGRLLMGAGSGFAFIGVTYVATTWIAKRHHGFVIGATQMMGMLGGIVGEATLAPMLHHTAWQHIWVILAVAAFVLVLLLCLTIPKRPEYLTQLEHEQGGVLKNYKVVVKSPAVWLCGCIGGLLFIPTTIFAMLWGVPFFMKAYHLTTEQAAVINSTVMLGWVIGSPVAGFLADRLGKRLVVMFVSNVLVLILFVLLAYTQWFDRELVMIMMGLMGFFSGAQILCFAIAKDANPEYAKASVIGGTNFLVFIWAAILTPLSGVILQWVHHGALATYSLSEYRYALILVVACLLLSLLLILALKRFSYYSS